MEFTDKKRKELAKEGEAMRGGAFPIRNKSDLQNAIQSIGRAKNYSTAESWIIKRAKELDLIDLLPEHWNIEKAALTEGDIDIQKAEKAAKKAKIKKVMDEWKNGTLKTSSGDKVKDQKQAIAITISESKRLKKAIEVEQMQPMRKEWISKYTTKLQGIQKKSNKPIKEIIKQLTIGFNVEKEHGDDIDKRIKTALDHLDENVEYYTESKPKNWGEKELNDELKKSLHKKLLRTEKIGNDSVNIYLVNGDYIRTFKDIEFIEGGHHYARPDLSKLIPKNEIWIEENLNEHDREGVITHESNEYKEMKFQHKDYGKAHEDSNKKEIKERRETIKKGYFSNLEIELGEVKSACAVVYDVNKQNILLGRSNALDDRNGKWCFVGGGIETGENVKQAAQRECFEESGITCNPTNVIVIDPEKPTVAFVLCHYVSGQAENTVDRPKAFDYFDWFRLNELPENIMEINKRVLAKML